MLSFQKDTGYLKKFEHLSLVLMSCFRGQRGLAESQKKELAQTPVLISCADQWNSAAVMRSHNMDIGNGALLSSMVTPSWRETWSGSFGHTPPSPCGEFAWARVLFLPAPCYLSVFPEAFLWFEGGCLSELLSPPLDALLEPVEEPSCPPVHGFSYTDGCDGFIVYRFVK